ncbi:MAG TPA: hypothetical protein H9776_10080 [Candidatus Mediterraneibacter intestinipullorum]|nr:hypothetical protein [Candidatus Mediterraneibacter intestinipullorum]
MFFRKTDDDVTDDIVNLKDRISKAEAVTVNANSTIHLTFKVVDPADE